MANPSKDEDTKASEEHVKRVRFSMVMRLYAAATDIKMKDIARQLEISDSMLHCIMEGKRDPGRAFRTMLAEWLLEDDL